MEFHPNIFNEIDINKYEKDHKIRQGGFGTVYEVKEKTTNKMYAAKVINGDAENEEFKKMINREIGVLTLIDHPTIIKLIGYSLIDFQRENNVTIIMELAKNGSLEDVLKKIRSLLGPHEYTNTSRQIILAGVARGMKYLHDRNIIHRDLKPGNILLDEDFHPLITDFGLSKFFKVDQSSIQTQACGTLIYKAPEVIQGINYNTKADVYSFAILMFEVVTDSLPYPELFSGQMSEFDFNNKIVKKNYRPTFKTFVKEPIKELIEKCWSSNPKERPNFGEIFDKLSMKNDDDAEKYLLDDVDIDEYSLYIDDISKISDNVDKLNDKIDKIEKENKKLRESNDHLSTENKNLKNDIDKLKEDNNQLNENNNELQKENKQQKMNLNKLIKENDQFKKDDRLNEDIIQLRKNNEKLNEENNQLKKETNQQNIKINKLEEENAKFKKDNGRLNNKNSKLNEDFGQLNEVNEKLNDENNQLKNTNDKLQKKIDKLKTEMNELKKENSKLQTNNNKLKNKYNQIFSIAALSSLLLGIFIEIFILLFIDSNVLPEKNDFITIFACMVVLCFTCKYYEISILYDIVTILFGFIIYELVTYQHKNSLLLTLLLIYSAFINIALYLYSVPELMKAKLCVISSVSFLTDFCIYLLNWSQFKDNSQFNLILFCQFIIFIIPLNLHLSIDLIYHSSFIFYFVILCGVICNDFSIYFIMSIFVLVVLLVYQCFNFNFIQNTNMSWALFAVKLVFVLFNFFIFKYAECFGLILFEIIYFILNILNYFYTIILLTAASFITIIYSHIDFININQNKIESHNYLPAFNLIFKFIIIIVQLYFFYKNN